MTYIPTLLWQTAVSVTLLVGSIMPASVHAGVLSSIIATLTASRAQYMADNSHIITADTEELALLSAAHNIDPNPSKGGGDITITDDAALLASSGPSGSLADVDSNTGTPSQHVGLYIVREGDTLSEIADMFDVTTNTVRWANDLSRSDTIHPGQELVILPMTGIRYEVKRGGTLRDIIEIYGGNLAEAAEYNDLDPDEYLDKGTEVMIPDGEMELKQPTNSWRADRSYTATPVYVRGSNAPEYSGYYMRPVVGGVKTQGLHGYNAIDIGAPINTPILASASGRVLRAKYSGWNGGYGNYVLIQHDNGTQTLYAHANEVVVVVGQQVVQGQVIAYMGSTGRSTGPHVHFEIRGAKNPF